MNAHPATWDALGGLFCYPDSTYAERLYQCRRAMETHSPEAATCLLKVEESLVGRSRMDMEELYTRTFDLNPTCTLDIGWHLYGEQYERGRFLVRCRDLLEELSIDEKGELPDHLSSLLSALGRLPEELAAPFAARFLLPALLVMRKALEKKESAFAGLLAAAVILAEEKKGDLPVAQPQQRLDIDLVQIGAGGKSPRAGRPMR
jgi:nitrate reductase delta subunit